MSEITLKQAIGLAWEQFIAGDFPKAESICRKVLQHDPNFPDALNCLGMIALTMKQFEPAAELIGRAVALEPLEPKFSHNFAEALVALHRWDEAIAHYYRAIETGHFPLSYSQLGNVLVHVGRLDEAIAAHRKVIELDPNFALGHSNLAVALQAMGRADEAIAEHRAALRIDPSLHAVHSLLLYALHLTTSTSPQEIFDAHRAWAQQHAPKLSTTQIYPNDRSPDRKLRIGYVSPEMMNQPVGRFLIPLLASLDRPQFETICFSAANQFDDVSKRLASHASGWHAIGHLNDTQLDELIRAQSIDILVDLAGHTVGNRLLALARKPAPVQVTCLGYPDTTGLDAFDYRLVDKLSDPPGLTDSFCTEKLVRLPRSFLCFMPLSAPFEAPPVAPLPAERNGFITFGSFNFFGKVSPEIGQIWARVLDAVPNSRLLIKSRYHADDATRADAMKLLTSFGIPPDRVTILVREIDQQSHLNVYREIDIALDTFPYHGTTTTCEALWMGAPVITLAGQTHVSRVGASLLAACGLADLIAHSADEYVHIAKKLSMDVEKLSNIRRTMRDNLQRSPLMDAAGYARDVGDAYREMWRAYCARA